MQLYFCFERFYQNLSFFLSNFKIENLKFNIFFVKKIIYIRIEVDTNYILNLKNTQVRFISVLFIIII